LAVNYRAAVLAGAGLAAVFTGAPCAFASAIRPPQLASLARPGSMKGRMAASGDRKAPSAAAAPAWATAAPGSTPSFGLKIEPWAVIGRFARTSRNFFGRP